MRAAQVIMETTLCPLSPETEFPPRAKDVQQLPQHLFQGQHEGQDYKQDTPPVLRHRQVSQRETSEKEKEKHIKVGERKTQMRERAR